MFARFTKALLQAGSAIIGKVRLVDDTGHEVTESGNHSVSVNIVDVEGIPSKVTIVDSEGDDITDEDGVRTSLSTPLPAGDNLIGSVSSLLKVVSHSKLLAAAGNYDIKDVLSEHATLGTAWGFSGMARKPGGGGLIIKAQAICSDVDIVPRLVLLLYKVAPTSMLNDNVASTAISAADAPAYIGKIDFPGMESFGGYSEALATTNTLSNLPLGFLCAADSMDLLGILITRDAEANESVGMKMEIRLMVEQF